MDRRDDGLTLQQIAEILGLSRQRVQQLEARALRKLRKRAALLGIRESEVIDHLRELARK